MNCPKNNENKNFEQVKKYFDFILKAKAVSYYKRKMKKKQINYKTTSLTDTKIIPLLLPITKINNKEEKLVKNNKSFEPNKYNTKFRIFIRKKGLLSEHTKRNHFKLMKFNTSLKT